MIADRKGSAPDPKSILQGMALLACGRAEGIERFGGTVDSFLAALAPGIAINLVSFMLVLMQHNVAIGLTKVELSVCALLAPPVISSMLARRWDREALWLRYATAVAWCEWVAVFVSVVAFAIASLLFPALARQSGFAQALVAAAELYGIWLGWFVTRTGLRLSRGRAALLYGASLLFAVSCYAVASLLPPHYSFVSDLLRPVVMTQSGT